MVMSVRDQKEWMSQWRRAAGALERQRKDELRALSEREALAASEALLSLFHLTALDPDRITSSGLVQQQALFHRRPQK
jgi:hypothetical protein